MQESNHILDDAREAHSDIKRFIAATNIGAIELSAITLRALLLLNGGAAVAMLGFVATVSSGVSTEQLSLLRVVDALQCYAIGAALAVLATGLAYIVMYLQAMLAQSHMFIWVSPYVVQGEKTKRIHAWYAVVHVSSVLVAVGSLVYFLLGVWATGEIVADVVTVGALTTSNDSP